MLKASSSPSATTAVPRLIAVVLLPCLFLIAITLSGCKPDVNPEEKPCLSGSVISDEEGRMEGVLVSAKRVDGNITVTVVSNAKGIYEFPNDRLTTGTYGLAVRATGYKLREMAPVHLEEDGSATADLKLDRTPDVAAQLTSAEWLESTPGTVEQKSKLYRCVACHDLGVVFHSKYDAKSWVPAIKRMEAWAAPSTFLSPVRLPTAPPKDPPDPKLAEYLASINLHNQPTWPFAFKPFPRPKGEETRFIVTEYDLPGPSLPHDAAVGRDGSIWYDDFQRPLIGRLDPNTGATKEWDLPVLRPGFPQGLLSIKIDKEGNAWVPRFFQGCTLVKVDTKTFAQKTWTVPEEFNGKASRCGHVALGAPGGLIWMSDSGGRKMFRLDTNTGNFETFDSFPGYKPDKTATSIETAGRKSKGHRTYGIGVDSKGNAYFADISGGMIGRVDAKTGEVSLYPTPTPSSGPRRSYMDSEDKYWFGENYSSKLGMFDTNTRQIQEWTPPVPWNGAYPAVRDKSGDVWTVGMSTDYIYRLNPGTGRFTKYLLPTVGANMRRIDADNSTSPATIWVAEVHKGKLAKIEILP